MTRTGPGPSAYRHQPHAHHPPVHPRTKRRLHKPALATGLLLVAVVLAGCTVPDDEIPGGDAGATTPRPDGDGTDATDETSEGTTDEDLDIGEDIHKPDSELRITFIDVGQGDGIVVEFPDSVLLVDAGRNSDASNDPIEDYLHQRGHATVHHFVVTHADADHSGGCDDIFDAFDVLQFYHPGADKDTQTWQECLDAAQGEAQIQTDAGLDPGDLLAFSSHATVTLLSIDADDGDHNEGGIALHIQYGAASAILAGDLGCDTEDDIRLQFPGLVDVDVLQAGHHGSKYSSCTPWLDATTPQHVAVSVGSNNYGHPTDEALSRIAASGADTWRTDHHGTITFSTDGTGWSVIPSTGWDPYVHEDPEPEPEPEGNEDGVYISDTQFDPPGNDQGENLVNEWVQITNSDNEAVNLDGWTLKDEADFTYTFGAFTLDAGASVKVRTGHGTDTEADVYWNRGSAVWNNTGDNAYLHDDGGSLIHSAAG